ncbi:MAG: hypothetical protein F4X98_02305 [Gammaproteobacteria bacterium]|nr:hypothetical protein [Gammaproteobacteria bacterium]
MPEEVGTERTRTNGPSADEQENAAETTQEPQVSGDAGEQGDAEESPPEAQGDDDTGDEAAPSEDLKVVVSIKGGRASIGVQQPSSDPHIETFGDHDLPALAQEVTAVTERARAGWQESPKHPAYERPAQPAGSRNRRGQGTAQNATAGAETEQAQQQALKLF